MRLLHHSLSASLAIVGPEPTYVPRLSSGMNSKEDSSHGLLFLTFTGRTFDFGTANGNDGERTNNQPRYCRFITVGQG